ncbi:hypothetical protein SAMN02910456_01445 [Ruminococcaceae bacterium YRB3002]|nr:hypothetical protein SAMN02910456_01445 [Ruminococcaceae bacterium YRB3002]
MKTVKDYIISLDTDLLVREFYYYHSDTLYACYYGKPLREPDGRTKSVTVFCYAEDQINQLREYIEYLKRVEITEQEDGKQGIIYAYSVLSGGWLSATAYTELIYKDELLKDPDNCEAYGYMFNKFSEILGFLVADNKFTQSHIYKVIADVLWEASWTGYRQEGLQEELDNLEEFENAKEENLNHYDSVEEMFTDLMGEDGYRDMIDRRHQETDESQKLLDEVRQAKIAYEKCSRLRERQMILEYI